jgi:hypothetical protein
MDYTDHTVESLQKDNATPKDPVARAGQGAVPAVVATGISSKLDVVGGTFPT